jgi:hypothetical protein
VTLIAEIAVSFATGLGVRGGPEDVASDDDAASVGDVHRGGQNEVGDDARGRRGRRAASGPGPPLQRSHAGRTRPRRRGAIAQRLGVADPHVVEEEAPRPKARRQRGHRARLHVLDDDPAAAAEAGVHVSFRYQPLDEENETSAAPATEDAPLDITLRIRATSATVQPSLIHTHLTDERGSPPSDFRVVPESQDPVTLRIDVLRRADGALIQQLRTVLPAAEAEGSKL